MDVALIQRSMQREGMPVYCQGFQGTSWRSRLACFGFYCGEFLDAQGQAKRLHHNSLRAGKTPAPQITLEALPFWG